MGLIEDVGRGAIGVDTAVFIYFIEEHARFLPIIEPLFRAADSGQCTLVTSALTLLEVLVVPYRAGNRLLAERYEKLLMRSRGIRVVDISRDQLLWAAQLRATTSIKTPDALQVAAALSNECTHLVTNDRRIPTIEGLQVQLISAYAS